MKFARIMILIFLLKCGELLQDECQREYISTEFRSTWLTESLYDFIDRLTDFDWIDSIIHQNHLPESPPFSFFDPESDFRSKLHLFTYLSSELLIITAVAIVFPKPPSKPYATLRTEKWAEIMKAIHYLPFCAQTRWFSGFPSSSASAAASHWPSSSVGAKELFNREKTLQQTAPALIGWFFSVRTFPWGSLCDIFGSVELDPDPAPDKHAPVGPSRGAWWAISSRLIWLERRTRKRPWT